MIKFEKPDVWGWEHAIRGMRNPLNSWEGSDTVFDGSKMCLGENDIDLMTRLIRGGAPHRKFLRQIFVSVDITAPLYWWKEFDTYKVGTTANSCSTMHKIQAKEFTFEDFSCEHLDEPSKDEPVSVRRFYGMENRRERIAFQGSETGTWEWYWLQNKVEDSASAFAHVNYAGLADYLGASYSRGVRPVFLLS